MKLIEIGSAKEFIKSIDENASKKDISNRLNEFVNRYGDISKQAKSYITSELRDTNIPEKSVSQIFIGLERRKMFGVNMPEDEYEFVEFLYNNQFKDYRVDLRCRLLAKDEHVNLDQQNNRLHALSKKLRLSFDHKIVNVAHEEKIHKLKMSRRNALIEKLLNLDTRKSQDTSLKLNIKHYNDIDFNKDDLSESEITIPQSSAGKKYADKHDNYYKDLSYHINKLGVLIVDQCSSDLVDQYYGIADFLYQLKVKMFNAYHDSRVIRVQNDTALILYSKKQKQGKTTLAREMLLDIVHEAHMDISIDYLMDKNNITQYESNFLFIIDEIKNAGGIAAVNKLKSNITANEFTEREIFTKYSKTVMNNALHLMTSNYTVSEKIPDRSGARRYLQINSADTRKTPMQTIQKAAKELFDYIDLTKPSPVISNSDGMTEERLEAFCNKEKVSTDLEDFIFEIQSGEVNIKDIFTPEVVKVKNFYNSFVDYQVSCNSSVIIRYQIFKRQVAELVLERKDVDIKEKQRMPFIHIHNVNNVS